METSEDKNWASKYLLDPLNAPEPSDETGPGASHTATVPPQPNSTASVQRKPTPPASAEKTGPAASVRSSNNPFRGSSGLPNNNYPSPPPSTSPRTSRFPDITPHTTGASTQIPTSTGGRNSTINGSGPSNNSGNSSPTSTMAAENPSRHRRTSSLKQRYPGDRTDRPLEMLRQDSKRAQRSPHLRKKHHVGADSIDALDNIGGIGAYHHEGPYDATLLARNMNKNYSPIAAVRGATEEALRATPREMVQDAVTKHRPLDGVAMVPPGMADRYGRVMRYQEGTDMMIEGQPEGGPYKRWPGVKYHPSDLKGKGEPSYSLEKALKDHRRNVSSSQAEGLDTGAIEMTSPAEQRRPVSAGSARPTSDGQRYADWERQGLGRSASGAGMLRKRFGSLRIGRGHGREGSG